MKKYLKLFAAFVFLIAAVTFAPAASKAASLTGLLTAPVDLKQTGADTNSVTFSWAAVINADDYCYSYSDGINWSIPKRVGGYRPEETIYNLSAGKTYYVKVYAMDENDNLGPESAALEVVTAPEKAGMAPVNLISKDATSINLSWNPASGATSYIIRDAFYKRYNYNIETPTTSASITGLAPSTYYSIDIIPVRTSSTGYKAMSEYVHEYISTENQITPPAKLPTANFAVSAPSSSSKTVTFIANDPSGKANGYEVEVRKMNGKLVRAITSTTTYSSAVNVSKNTPYKYRVRLFTSSGANKMFGEWSGYRYFWLHKISGKKHYNTASRYAKIKLSWSKVSGAKGYDVSIATSKNGKYKKVKSLGKKAKKITISKYGKKRLSRYKTYYIKVKAKVKDGKKTVNNDTQIVNYNY